jgi:hypothetical protein
LYEWLYVSGFVHPRSGRNLQLPPPAVNVDWMSLALAEFARWADPEGRKPLVLLADNAGWHRAKRRAVPPDGLPHHLPPCPPEWPPAERPWPLVREALANASVVGLEEMEPVLARRCRDLIEQPEVVRGAVGFHGTLAMNG